MTPQERDLLDSFLNQLGQARADPKDPEADARIRAATAGKPDASYLLVQRAMGLDLALQAAQAQIEKLQGELARSRGAAAGAASGSTFLGSADSWGRSGGAAAPASSAPLAPLAARPAGIAGPVPASPWGSGMMASIATTAAGVVAGSFLYQGIQNLMGHHNDAVPAAANEPLGDQQIAQALDEDVVDSGGLDDGGADDGGSDTA